MAQRNARAPLGGAAGRTFDDGSDDDGGEVTLGHQLSAKRNGFAERKRATADRASSAFAWEAAKAAGGHKRQRSWEAPREEEDGEDEDDEAGSGDDDAPRAASARRFQRGGSGSSEDSGDDDDGEEDGEDGSGGGPGGKRKRNKHAPAEMPTNKPVRRFRMAVDVPKVIRRGACPAVGAGLTGRVGALAALASAAARGRGVPVAAAPRGLGMPTRLAP